MLLYFSTFTDQSTSVLWNLASCWHSLASLGDCTQQCNKTWSCTRHPRFFVFFLLRAFWVHLRHFSKKVQFISAKTFIHNKSSLMGPDRQNRRFTVIPIMLTWKKKNTVLWKSLVLDMVRIFGSVLVQSSHTYFCAVLYFWTEKVAELRPLLRGCVPVALA